LLIDNFPISVQDLFNLAQTFSEEPGTCLLYSGGHYDSAQQSFLCLFPTEFLWIQNDKLWRRKACRQRPLSYQIDNPWDSLKCLLKKGQETPYPQWVGYLGYEMGAYSDYDKKISLHRSPYPDAFFMRPSLVIIFDHHKSCGRIMLAEEYLPSAEIWLNKLRHIDEWPRTDPTGKSLDDRKSPPIKFDTLPESEETYCRKIEKAKKLICSGDIYQINLSQKFILKGKKNPFALFKNVVSTNPAPFTAFMQFPDFTIVSSSPERLLSKKGCKLETRPIKGTAPRHKNQEQDRHNRETLLSSPKEQAELLMITDLMRNDLGKISRTGSVKTKKIWHCEGYANVFHLLSIIESEALPHLHPLDILRAVFPGGSITGCPKLRAIELIRDLEQRSRGIYTGSIGYFASNGDFDFNIAIRTLVCQTDLIDLQLGGAIVFDSEPQKEYQEIYHKGMSLFQVLGKEI